MPILNWLTRDADTRAAAKVPYRLLEEVPEHSAGASDTGNMLIQGDNLEALNPANSLRFMVVSRIRARGSISSAVRRSGFGSG